MRRHKHHQRAQADFCLHPLEYHTAKHVPLPEDHQHGLLHVFTPWILNFFVVHAVSLFCVAVRRCGTFPQSRQSRRRPIPTHNAELEFSVPALARWQRHRPPALPEYVGHSQRPRTQGCHLGNRPVQHLVHFMLRQGVELDFPFPLAAEFAEIVYCFMA